jgi:hypothetical protein
MGQVGYEPRYICLRFISVKHILCHKLLACIWMCWGGAWDCMLVSMVSRGIAYVKLSPLSDNRRYLFEGLQGVTNSCIISNASLTFALAPVSLVHSRMHH